MAFKFPIEREFNRVVIYGTMLSRAEALDVVEAIRAATKLDGSGRRSRHLSSGWRVSRCGLPSQTTITMPDGCNMYGSDEWALAFASAIEEVSSERD